MDGLIRGAEERSRLQRFPWHEQIDTTAPPPKCLVLSKIGRWCTKCWWDIMTPEKVMTTCSPLDPLELWQDHTPCLWRWRLQNCPWKTHFLRNFYTREKQGHLASRQLRYSEGQECLYEASSGLNSEQDPCVSSLISSGVVDCVIKT